MLDDKRSVRKRDRLAYLFLNPSYYRSQQVLDFDFSNEKRKYILKSIPYDSVRRLNMTKLPCDTP